MKKKTKEVPTARKLSKEEANKFLTNQVVELQKSLNKNIQEINYLRAVNITLANELAHKSKQFSFKKLIGLK